MISNFVSQYLPPILVAVIVMLALLLLIAMLGMRGEGRARQLWGGIVQQRVAVAVFCGVVLFIVAFGTFIARSLAENRVADRETAGVSTVSNLITTGFLPTAPLTHTVSPVPPPRADDKDKLLRTRDMALFGRGTVLASNVMVVQPGQPYRVSFKASAGNGSEPQLQVRQVWFDPSLNITAYHDSAVFSIPRSSGGDSNTTAPTFHTEVYEAPAGATRVQIEIRDTGNTGMEVLNFKFSAEGVYVEPHPNGTQGAIAFSFDWESAMGGAIHSQGMEAHDVAGATQHGILMREGADWLNGLFAENDIKATFYATGYNLLDGNTERRTFSGDPTYKWAKPKNNWASDYWLTHKWFSDDPFGTYQSNPGWYFGDQTRELLQAGHEIAPHTFGHLYVRGSNPTELGTDMDEWLKAAQAVGVPAPTTFAFPWRSSNSLSADFYQTLYDRGIRAVTRLYPLDIRDLYTLGAAPVYSNIAVMPDFLLGAPASSAGEEASGAPIGVEEATQVISETLARRGTTSFWTHPEQLGNDPSLQPVRSAWQRVVSDAARERDRGRLWIGTVAEITAYQRDVMSVTVSLSKGSGGRQMVVDNASGHEIGGVTLTLPGEAVGVDSPESEVRTVQRSDTGHITLSKPGENVYPTRQLVITTLKPGTTSINVQWEKGQEPQT